MHQLGAAVASAADAAARDFYEGVHATIDAVAALDLPTLRQLGAHVQLDGAGCLLWRLLCGTCYLWASAVRRTPASLGLLLAESCYLSGAVVAGIADDACPTTRELFVGDVIEAIGDVDLRCGQVDAALRKVCAGPVTLRVRRAVPISVRVDDDAAGGEEAAADYAEVETSVVTTVTAHASPSVSPPAVVAASDAATVAVVLSWTNAQGIARRKLGVGAIPGDQARTQWPVCWALANGAAALPPLQSLTVPEAPEAEEAEAQCVEPQPGEPALPGVREALGCYLGSGIVQGGESDSGVPPQLRAPTTRAACGLGCCRHHACVRLRTNKHFARTQLVHAKAQLGIPVLKPRRSGVGHGFLLAEMIPYSLWQYHSEGRLAAGASEQLDVWLAAHRGDTSAAPSQQPTRTYRLSLCFIGDGAPLASKTFLNLGVGLADRGRDRNRETDSLFALGRSQYIPMIKAWEKEESIYMLEQLVMGELASVCREPLAFGPFALEIEYLSAASDFKFLWITHNLGGTGAFRSPSHLVSMGKFLTVVRHPVHRRSLVDIERFGAAERLWLSQVDPSANEPETNRRRNAMFGGLSRQSSEKRRSPFGCNYPSGLDLSRVS